MSFKIRSLSSDPRLIYVLLAIVLLTPIIARIPMIVPASPTTRAVFDFIKELPPGAFVVLSFDYSTGTVPELHPQAIVVTQHLFMKQARILLVAQWQDGPALADAVLDAVEKGNSVYGEDYVNLGYIGLSSSVVIGIAQNIRQFYSRDARGTPTSQLKLFDRFSGVKEAALVVSFTGNEPGVGVILQYWQAPFNLAVAVGSTGISAPSYLPFLASRQIIGILISLRAAAEYEALIERPGISGASAAMVAQSTSHIMIVLAVVVGNVAYLASRRERGPKA